MLFLAPKGVFPGVTRQVALHCCRELPFYKMSNIECKSQAKSAIYASNRNGCSHTCANRFHPHWQIYRRGHPAEACKRNNLRHDDSIQGSLLCIPKPGCHYIYNVRVPVSQPLLISPEDLSTQYRPPASNKRCDQGHGEWCLRRIYHIYNHINDRVTNWLDLLIF